MKEGSYVYLERRSKGVEFEIRDPGEGVEFNVRKSCDVEAIKKYVNEESEKSNSIDNTELLKFANDSWGLAVKLEKELISLKKKYEEIIINNTKKIKRVRPGRPKKIIEG